jgi:hypothetical protein
MKFYLVDGEVRFLTHKVEWQERGETQTREFYDPAKKDAFIARLTDRGIEYTVTELEQPTQSQIDRVVGRKFNTIEEARKAINGTEEPSKDELIQLMALAIASLDAEIQNLKGGSAE